MTGRRYIKDFDEFLARFQHVGSMREVLSEFDIPALLALKGVERQEAEEVLIERLDAGFNDARIPPTLEVMESRSAIPVLRRRSRGLDETAVGAALAFWRLAAGG